MPTLEEIARLSGVSRSTVSRVINDDPHVSEATRAKVLAVVHERRYQPHAAARSLAGGQTRILGLLVPGGIVNTFRDSWFADLVRAMSKVCQEHNYSVMLWLLEPGYETEMVRRVLQNRMLDGLLVVSGSLVESKLDALLQTDLPFVVIGRPPARHDAVSYVDVDNRQGAKMVVRHLLRAGYRRIAHIAGPLDEVGGEARMQGYLDALREWGISDDDVLVAEGDYTEAGGYHAMKRLLPLAPDALFAANDVMAIGAMRALREAGGHVPEDLAVVGFDDAPGAASVDPPLTTVRQPTERFGRVVIEMLIDMVEHHSRDPQHIVLPTELVIRASCGTE